jgi:hypothetical protein
MKKQAVKKARKEVKTIKNPVVLFLLALLLAILCYIIYASYRPQVSIIDTPIEKICEDNQTHACTSGSCNGTSTCVDNSWSSCTWEKICVPGSRAMCIEDGCAYAVKECNECGTGYGPCGLP